MKLLTYIQQHYGLSRRAITDAIKHGLVAIDGKQVEGYTTELSYGQHLTGRIADRRLDDRIQDARIESELILFHKPVGYVCSKFDAHNKTIYRLLGTQYSNYYYIGRLDKESRGLVLLTNDPAIVHKYEHPRHKVEKEYIVTMHIKGDFLQRLLDGTKEKNEKIEKIGKSGGVILHHNLEYLFTKGLLVDEDGKLGKKDSKNCDLLKVVSIAPVETLDKQLRALGITDLTPRNNVHTYRIVLNEGKKRHIRRLMSAVGGEVLDLVRVRIGEYTLDGIEQDEVKIAMGKGK